MLPEAILKNTDYMLEVSIFQKCRVMLYEKVTRPEISNANAERGEMQSSKSKYEYEV